MKLKNLLIISICMNLVIVGFVFKKWRSKWFDNEPTKLPFRENVFSGKGNKAGLIYFLGDSHTEAFELNEYLENQNVRNRGIWGDNSISLKNRLGEVVKTIPKQIFIMIGVNDIIQGSTPESVAKNIMGMIDSIKVISPKTKICVESVLPTDHLINNTKEPSYGKIVMLNKAIKKLTEIKKVKYLDVFRFFSNGKALKPEYSYDGLHMTGKGYNKLAGLIKPELIP